MAVLIVALPELALQSCLFLTRPFKHSRLLQIAGALLTGWHVLAALALPELAVMFWLYSHFLS